MFKWRRKKEDETKKAESLLKSSAYPVTPPLSGFQEQLKQELLKKRHLEPVSSNISFPKISWQVLIPATMLLAVVLLVIPLVRQEFPQEFKKAVPAETVIEEPVIEQIQPAVKKTERKMAEPALKKAEPVLPKAEPAYVPPPAPSEKPVLENILESKEFFGPEVLEEEAVEGEEEAQAEEALGESMSIGATAPMLLMQPSVSLSRSYEKDSNAQDIFQEGEIIEVILFADLKGDIEGGFEIIDVLPKGLVYSGPLDAPSRVSGNKVFFNFYPGQKPVLYSGSVCYLAKAVSKGKFIAPPATIKSLEKPEIKGVSSKTRIEIQ